MAKQVISFGGICCYRVGSCRSWYRWKTGLHLRWCFFFLLGFIALPRRTRSPLPLFLPVLAYNVAVGCSWWYLRGGGGGVGMGVCETVRELGAEAGDQCHRPWLWLWLSFQREGLGQKGNPRCVYPLFKLQGVGIKWWQRGSGDERERHCTFGGRAR